MSKKPTPWNLLRRIRRWIACGVPSGICILVYCFWNYCYLHRDYVAAAEVIIDPANEYNVAKKDKEMG